MERQRLRALAEVQASIELQRIWRRARGRSVARHRATTVAFARETAETYSNPARFAIANLRAFNTHGGYLGSSGVDARSLLAAATRGEQEQDVSAHCPRGLDGSKAKCKQGRDTIWLQLAQGVDEGGLSAAAVAGITEVGIRVCLRRCVSFMRDSTSDVSTADLPKEESELDMTNAEELLNTRKKRLDIASRPWIERGGSDPKKGESSVSYSGNHQYGDFVDDGPPLTLKLELISVEKSEKRPTDHNRGLAEGKSHEDMGQEDDDHHLAVVAGAYGNDGDHRELFRSDSSTSTVINDSVGDGDASSNTSDSSGNNNSSSPSSTSCTSSNNNSSSNGRSSKTSTTATGNGFLVNTDHVTKTSCIDLTRGHHQCVVAWCGKNVGGTRAPPAGLPVPRWEGQVFYLPLCAAASRSDTVASAVTTESKEDYREDDNKPRVVADGWAQKHCPSAQYARGETITKPPPPLLSVTLNRLPLRGGGCAPCWGGTDILRQGHWREDQDGSIASAATEENLSSWSAFLTGKIRPVPIARTVLEAGDVLSMLGSQQVQVYNRVRIRSRREYRLRILVG